MPSAFGFFFLGVAAFFYATRYVCAAMICAGFSSASEDLFNHAYVYVGPNLTVLSALSFLISVGIFLYPFYAWSLQRWLQQFTVEVPRN